MKNIFSFLLISLLFIGCSSEQDEKYDYEVLGEKVVQLKTRSNESNKLKFPPVYLTINHASYYSKKDIIFEIPNSSEEDIIKMKQKYGSLPQYYNLNENCHIQYQYDTNRGWSDWYYYHPDSVLCKTPYTIETNTSTYSSSREAILKAYMFPASKFRYRVKIFNSDIETEWLENYSFESWLANENGFTDSNPPVSEATGIPVRIEIGMLVMLELDVYKATEDGVYKVNFGSMSKDIEYTKGTYGSHRVFFTYTTTVYTEPYRVTYVDIPYNGGTYRKMFTIDDSYTPTDILRFDESIILRAQVGSYL